MNTATVALGIYVVIVAGLLLANHGAHRPQPTARIAPPYPADVPVPIPWHDASLLADQPTEVWLTDELADRLFDELIALEGWK